MGSGLLKIFVLMIKMYIFIYPNMELPNKMYSLSIKLIHNYLIQAVMIFLTKQLSDTIVNLLHFLAGVWP